MGFPKAPKIVMEPAYGVLDAARPFGLALMVRVSGVLPPLGLTESQLFVEVAKAPKLYEALELVTTRFWVTGEPLT